ncbi:DUF6320 domain-containing protein [Bacillus sp. 1P06AnD]|uniref:DUF6320 domain-containing protein n=1 Tax=Bacillus sp. 1P06AnD TaxID=3132208 RepID=UPI0039A3A444
MTLCPHCHVYIDEHLDRCPLCLKGMPACQKKEGCAPLYPEYRIKPANHSVVVKIWLFLSIISCSISFLVNMLTLETKPIFWCIYVISIVLYAWLLIRHTFLSKRNAGEKIVVQTIGSSLLLFIIDLNSGYEKWSVNIVIPVIIMVSIVCLAIFMAYKHHNWKAYLNWAIVDIILGFFPLLLFAVRLSDVFWTSAVSALFSILAITGLIIFAEKRFKAEVIRRFHL